MGWSQLPENEVRTVEASRFATQADLAKLRAEITGTEDTSRFLEGLDGNTKQLNMNFQEVGLQIGLLFCCVLIISFGGCLTGFNLVDRIQALEQAAEAPIPFTTPEEVSDEQ